MSDPPELFQTDNTLRDKILETTPELPAAIINGEKDAPQLSETVITGEQEAQRL